MGSIVSILNQVLIVISYICCPWSYSLLFNGSVTVLTLIGDLLFTYVFIRECKCVLIMSAVNTFNSKITQGDAFKIKRTLYISLDTMF